ncbi:MAG: hypothetical protein RMM98_07935 [Acidobacteriota bacterium]|nr:hypothetical protein [Blastocatellia bacterium]MDW8239529.1 hypothetical protein [Acidobacteriota bacterium]
MRFVVILLAVSWTLTASVHAQDLAAQAKAELELAQTNHLYITTELEQMESLLKEAQAHLDRQRDLFERGLIPRQKMEQAERLVRERQTLVDLLSQQKKLAEQSVAYAEEAVRLVERQQTLQRSTPVSSSIKRVTKSYGRGTWSATDFQELARAFRETFGRPLPITALGQTQTHDRLGYNHQHRMDVGVHPDGPEGQWIIQYLEKRGIPYIAFRSGVPGHATGPHIHIGLPSPRF